jgi:hypothetical protein
LPVRQLETIATDTPISDAIILDVNPGRQSAISSRLKDFSPGYF